jgi:hypothetical protein
MKKRETQCISPPSRLPRFMSASLAASPVRVGLCGYRLEEDEEFVAVESESAKRPVGVCPKCWGLLPKG